jgi:hypothetical protein
MGPCERRDDIEIGMGNMQRSPDTAARGRKPKARKFYTISYSLRHGLADFEVENLDILLMGARALCPPEGRRGFPAYPEKPRLVIGKRKRGPPPSDIELYHSYWLISDRLKSLFEAFDPAAFAFQACNVRLRDGSPGPAYWLCDVIRVLDAFGEDTLQEIRRYQEKTGYRYRGFSGEKSLVFNEPVIGPSHIFVTPYSRADVFCDQGLKDACKAAGIKGVAFNDCTAKPKKTAPPPVTSGRTGNPLLRKMSDRLLGFADDAKTVSLAVAVRSALRAMPLLERLSWDRPLRKRMRARLGRDRMTNSANVLGTFRSAATAWVAARFPAFGSSDRFHEIKQDARMAGGYEDAGNTPASYAAFAPHWAMMAAIAVFSDRFPQNTIGESRHREEAARSAAQTTRIAALGFMEAYDPEASQHYHAMRDPQAMLAREPREAERIIWDAAWQDIRRLENGSGAPALLAQPLWPTQAPQYARDDWLQLSARLLGRDIEHWDAWTAWYEARLAGGGTVSETDEIARVSLPNEIWAQGATAANARIAGLNG